MNHLAEGCFIMQIRGGFARATPRGHAKRGRSAPRTHPDDLSAVDIADRTAAMAALQYRRVHIPRGLPTPRTIEMRLSRFTSVPRIRVRAAPGTRLTLAAIKAISCRAPAEADHHRPS